MKLRAVMLVAAWAICTGAYAQAFPTKPLRLVVPFPPGGVTDISSRVVAQKLSAELGQPVVVENRAGASGVIGAEIGAKAAPDGYTLTMGNISTLAINAVTFAKLPYDPVASFAPVSMVAIQPLVIAVHPSVPAQTLAELVALAKAQPGKLNFGTAGSSIYLAVEFFNTAAGISMNHVPYKGSAPAITDLVGGQLQVLFDPFSSLYPQVRSGKARGLALTTAKRSAMAPALPTVAELGYPGFDVSSWQGIVVPAGTPKAIVERLNREVVKALASPEVRDQFALHSAEASPSTPEQFGAYIRQEIARWRKVARDAGVKPE
ncbi:MAG: tripartite tricarboxylate transporter substrate binding protein [Betaproteobacteria bacterium]